MNVSEPPAGDHSAAPSEEHSGDMVEGEAVRGDATGAADADSTASSTGTSTTDPSPEVMALRAELAHCRLIAHDVLKAWAASEDGGPPDEIKALALGLDQPIGTRERMVLADVVYDYGRRREGLAQLDADNAPAAKYDAADRRMRDAQDRVLAMVGLAPPKRPPPRDVPPPPAPAPRTRRRS